MKRWDNGEEVGLVDWWTMVKRWNWWTTVKRWDNGEEVGQW